MVRGIDRFREHFRGHAAQFVLIGGVAADAWFTRAGLTFRATKDIDIVLLVEALDDAFLRRTWEFVRAGRYARKERSDERRTYYRFSKPADVAFPEVIEFFARAPEGIDGPADQEIVPIPADEDALASMTAGASSSTSTSDAVRTAGSTGCWAMTSSRSRHSRETTESSTS